MIIQIRSESARSGQAHTVVVSVKNCEVLLHEDVPKDEKVFVASLLDIERLQVKAATRWRRFHQLVGLNAVLVPVNVEPTGYIGQDDRN